MLHTKPKSKQLPERNSIRGEKIAKHHWLLLLSFLAVTGCAPTTIEHISPNPANTGEQVSVDMSGVIGPGIFEPGAELEFDGSVLPVNPDTSSQVGFAVPAIAAAGPHQVTITDKIGLLEALLIFPLFKDRTDTKTLNVTHPRDISAAHFEITQGLQRDANDIPLVQGKPTVIRIFPVIADGGTDIAGITAELHASRGGAELPGSPIAPDNGPISVSNSFDREEPNDSLNFTLDPDWYAQDTDFWAEVQLPASFSDSNPVDNRIPSGAGTHSAVYNNRDGLDIRYVKVNYDNTNWTGPVLPRPHVSSQATGDWLRALYPADPLEIEYDPWIPDTMTFTQAVGVSLNDNQLISELNVLFNASADPGDRLYGWTPEGSIAGNGLSDPLWAGGQNNVACGNDTEGSDPPLTSRYRRTFTHEIGHNTDAAGLFHTSRRLEDDEYGYDVLGVDPFDRIVMRKYPSTDPNPSLDLFDFMRPGELEPHAWITPPYYDYLYNWMAPGFAADARVAVSSAEIETSTEFLAVRGIVSRTGEGGFYPFYRIPSNPTSRRSASTLPTEGTHEVRFLDAAGGIIKSIKWTPDFRADDSEEERESRPFVWIIPPNDAIKSVQLRIDNRTVATLNVADKMPPVNDLEIVNISKAGTAASAANTNQEKNVTLRWNAGKERAALSEGGARSELVHQVYFSRDNGSSWILVRSGLDSPNADIDLSKLPGGDQTLFRISTSDGFNVSTLTTAPMEVADKAPVSGIVAPRTALERLEKGGILFVGRGFDLEDGVLPGSNLTWYSDQQGELGTGEKLVVRDLTVGKHTVTLRGRDSTGKESVSDPVTITIKSRSN